MPTSRLPRLAGLTLVLAAAAAVAQTPAKAPARPAVKAAAAAPETPKVPTLTRAELRACMAQKDEMEVRKAAYDRDVKAHEEAGAALAKETAELTAAKDLVDTKKIEDVTAFNARVAKRNEAGEAHNARAGEINASGAAWQELQTKYVADCNDKPFLVGDREAVLKERAAAAAASAAAK